jgi:hypothetical protein
MEFIFIGNPDKHGEGPSVLDLKCPETGNTFVFEKEGKPVDVGEGKLAGKLKGNSHFKAVEKSKPLARKSEPGKPEHGKPEHA